MFSFNPVELFFNSSTGLETWNIQKIVPPDWKHGIFKGRQSPLAVHKEIAPPDWKH